MSNMSYCRFQNTYGDLLECLDALVQDYKLSEEEYYSAMRMFKEFLLFCKEAEIIENYDYERVEEYLSERRTGGN